MITCSYCIGQSPDDAHFCIECGKPIKSHAYVDGTKRLADYQPSAIPTGAPYANPYLDYRDLSNKNVYYIYKADLGALLGDVSTYVVKKERGYDIYYHGRRIVFMD